MGERGILIINHGNFEKEFLGTIAESITREYHLPVSVKVSHIDLSEFYDPMRRQYNGNKLMKELDFWSTMNHIKNIGLFRVDLFNPILTYIFGQAALKGSIGVASLYRLRNEQYGMKKDDDLLLVRFQKVIIHELGHMFGLVHCHFPTCVMRSSTYVEDIDQKSPHLCSKCRNEIGIKP
ncbi:MAG: archaemetzincin family Zn-dependent metalloprotease [Bacteroidota bacterium]